MEIGFILPTGFALDGPGNGVRVQAQRQAEAMERLGHEVVRLNPWESYSLDHFDVIQFFVGGFPVFRIEENRPHPVRNLVFAPMIDTNEPNWRYRLATVVGSVLPKVYTIPAVFRRQASACNLVVCRSTHEREKIVTGLGIDPARVAVEIVLNGVSPPALPDLELVHRLGLPEQFVLHVSTYTQPRKNARRLVEAVAPTGLPLVIAGTAAPGPALDHLELLARRWRNIRLLGYQDAQTLNALYAACRVFCLPSLHEGTGLVALEAASHGAGVVITRNGGPPDYFGELAYYVDPYDVTEIRLATARAWENPNGEALRRHVLSDLTWDRSAQALISAYRKHLF